MSDPSEASLHRPQQLPAAQEHEEHHLKQESPDWSVVSRTAVLADAEGLLTCYGVGEDSTGQLTHAVIELCFTSSVRFLQPGLLLQVRYWLCQPTGPIVPQVLGKR